MMTHKSVDMALLTQRKQLSVLGFQKINVHRGKKQESYRSLEVVQLQQQTPPCIRETTRQFILENYTFMKEKLRLFIQQRSDDPSTSRELCNICRFMPGGD